MRSKPSQARSRETVRAVLQAANDEFGEHGFHAAQMTRIAERAGVSPGSMYRFFPDKQDLAAALSDLYLQAVIEDLGPIVNEFDGLDDLASVIDRLVFEGARLQLEHAGYYRLSGDVSPLAESWVETGVLDTLSDGFVDRLNAVGVRRIDGGDLRLITDFAIETTRSWLTHMPLEGPERQELLDELRTMLCCYMGNRLVGS